MSQEQLTSEVNAFISRPGVTFFTNGKISRFETQAEAASLIEQEMRKNVDLGLGTYLKLLQVRKIETYGETSALCWLDWEFVPQKGSEYEGRGWKFTDVYGYRAASEGLDGGWEFVLRDEQITAMVKATGQSFAE